MEVFAFDVDASAMAEAMSVSALRLVAHTVLNELPSFARADTFRGVKVPRSWHPAAPFNSHLHHSPPL